MVDADRKRFADILGAIATMFRAEVSKPLLEIYWLGLRDLDLAKFEVAVERSIKLDEFMPPVARLRELAHWDPLPVHVPPPRMLKAGK